MFILSIISDYASQLIEPNMSVSLGGGHNVFDLVKIIKDKGLDQTTELYSPSEKISQQLDPKIPLCLEIAEPALDQILKLAELLGLDAQVRMAQATATYARSPLGNLLVDLYASSWQDIVAIENKLVKENGVISSSLFANLVTGVISEKNQTGFIFKGE